MESWRKVWREGIAPQFSDGALQAIRKALEEDDERLLQGATCSPPPFSHMQRCKVDAACLVGYAIWQGDGIATVGELDKKICAAFSKADRLVGEDDGYRYFLDYFDDEPRDRMRVELLAEVNWEISRRGKLAAV